MADPAYARMLRRSRGAIRHIRPALLWRIVAAARRVNEIFKDRSRRHIVELLEWTPVPDHENGPVDD